MKGLLSEIFGLIVKSRNALFDKGYFGTYRSRFPVISIGNITAGGNGKTPLCLHVVEELQKLGKKPVILSRGYKGKLKGPHQISESDRPQDVGDEPLMLRKKNIAPVVIAKSRVTGAKFIEQKNLGDVIVLDDGFQHRWLARNLDIVCQDVGNQSAVTQFVADTLLPAGTLREPREKALQRAQAIVFSERKFVAAPAAISTQLRELLPESISIFRAMLQPQGLFSVAESSMHHDILPANIIAFCSIANPAGFFSSLEALGMSCATRILFPDHHDFTAADLRKLLATHQQLPFVCTEKDQVKLEKLMPELTASEVKRFLFLKVSLTVQAEGGSGTFAGFLSKFL